MLAAADIRSSSSPSKKTLPANRRGVFLLYEVMRYYLLAIFTVFTVPSAMRTCLMSRPLA